MDEKFGGEVTQALTRYYATQPGRLNTMLDLRLRDCSRDEQWIEYTFLPKDWCLNQSGGVHGGIVASVLDYGCGVLAYLLSQKMVVTTDLSVSYLRGLTGSEYRVLARANHVGGTIVNCTGQILEPGGKICATAQITYFAQAGKKPGVRD